MYRTSVHTYKQICRKCRCTAQRRDTATQYMRLCGFYAGQSSAGQVRLRLLWFSLASIIPPFYAGQSSTGQVRLRVLWFSLASIIPPFYAEQSSTGQVLLRVLWFSLASIIPPLLHTHLFICHRRN
jgi:hypothetical protein